MQVSVTLYGSLRIVTGRQVLSLFFDAPSITMGQLLDGLVITCPRIKPYLFDATDQKLRTDIKVLLNGTKPKSDLQFTTPLYDNDRIMLMLAVPSHY
jgi:hypothetical protein